MRISFDFQILLPLVALFVALALILRAWRYHNSPIAVTFLLFLTSVAVWSMAVVIEHSSSELLTKILWKKISYFGITTLPAIWLVFTLQYTDRVKWLTHRNFILLTILPFITLIMVWTNELHGLIWKDIWLDNRLSPPVDAVSHNTWFWIYVIYAYSLLLLGTLTLFNTFLRSSSIYRKQMVTLLLATLVPWIGNCLFVFGIKPFDVIDPAPLAFTLTSLAFFWGLTRFQLLDIMPIAQEAIFRSMVDGVVVLDTRQRIIELNPAARQIIQRTRAEVIGQHYQSVLPGQAALLEVKSKIADSQAVICLGQGETQRYYAVHVSPISIKLRFGGHLVIMRDDTERIKADVASREKAILETELIERRRSSEAVMSLNLQLEAKVEDRTRQLADAVAVAEASNQAKSQFLASMSHELRTPLNAILGFSQILHEQFFGALNEKQLEYMGDIVDSGQHLLSLINDILDISRIEAGKMELEISAVNIKDLISSSLVLIKEKALAHHIDLTVNMSSDIDRMEIMADARRLKQVMYNLLSNAAKFTPDGGAIRVEAGKQEGDLIVSVADTGIGISSSDQQKLFRPFYQVNNGIKDKTPGTGLGLSITRSIVELHGGRIWMESEGTDKGSRFTFSLPVNEPVVKALMVPVKSYFHTSVPEGWHVNRG